MVGLSSSSGTSTVSFARVGSRFSTALFTALLSTLRILRDNPRTRGSSMPCERDRADRRATVRTGALHRSAHLLAGATPAGQEVILDSRRSGEHGQAVVGEQ